MAQVHRAIAMDSEVQRPVALKRMLSHIASSEDMVKSFVREARLASYLRHENVAQTYDLGRVGDVYFIVMELITGRNLREVLRHCGATTGPMPVQVALNILNQICDALDYAHNLRDETGEPLGIIHRDVSPSNVIVSDSGVVKLIDFGIAKASGAGMQTMGGTLKGKFGYMAPEYIAGRLDARADLFAVGVIAHELLTNRPLFSGRDDIDTLTRVRDMHIDPPSRKNPLVPPEIDDIVMTALERDPDRRWQHATALRTALTTLTRRLDLVATNLQVVQWLDWAFAHKRMRKGRAEPDTDPDGAPLDDETSDPSIAIDPRTPSTVSLSPTLSQSLAANSQKVTLMMRDGEPSPPTKTPVGTPGYVPVQHHPSIDPVAAPVAGHPAGNGAKITTPAVVPPVARPSAAHPSRRPSASSPPPVASAPAVRPSTPQLAAPPALSSVNRPPAPSVNRLPAPHATALGAGVPSSPLASGPLAASRPVALSPAQAITYEAVRTGQAGRGFAPSPAAPVVAAPRRSGRAVGVVLVVLAAAVAAITVYFVLPLLT